MGRGMLWYLVETEGWGRLGGIGVVDWLWRSSNRSFLSGVDRGSQGKALGNTGIKEK